VPQGRYGERQDEHAQCPVAESILDCFDRVGAKAAAITKQLGEENAGGQQAGQENDRLADPANCLCRVNQ
jgi:hypothetical protein